jgi:hypothetical protein
METWKHGDVETWKHGVGDKEAWRHRYEKCKHGKWRHRDMEIETWK